MSNKTFVTIVLVCLPFVSFAQVNWEDLSAEQQQTLSRFEGDWAGLDAAKQERLAKRADRPPAETAEQAGFLCGHLSKRSLTSLIKFRAHRRVQLFSLCIQQIFHALLTSPRRIRIGTRGRSIETAC